MTLGSLLAIMVKINKLLNRSKDLAKFKLIRIKSSRVNAISRLKPTDTRNIGLYLLETNFIATDKKEILTTELCTP